jgi:hypothetical protein
VGGGFMIWSVESLHAHEEYVIMPQRVASLGIASGDRRTRMGFFDC